MSSVKNRYRVVVEYDVIIEEYINGGYGCPDLNLMGYTTIAELKNDIEKLKIKVYKDKNNMDNCSNCYHIQRGKHCDQVKCKHNSPNYWTPRTIKKPGA